MAHLCHITALKTKGRGLLFRYRIKYITNMSTTHKSGFVNIVGNPNVGKSTLMNDLVGERISIITSKAQTTRHRIMGIVNTPEYQIVFSDTPGVLSPKYKLQESMLAFSEEALTDADVLVYVTDVVEDPSKNAEYLAKVAQEKVPVLLVINKIDLLKNNGELDAIVARWREMLPNAEIFPISAKEHFNVSNLMARIVALLPEGEPYFGKDALTDKPARFFVTEIIREKILLNYDKEVPYSTEVIVEKFEESERLDSHHGRHLCRARQPEGHSHRQRRLDAQTRRHRGPQGYREILRQTRLSRALRQGRAQLA